MNYLDIYKTIILKRNVGYKVIGWGTGTYFHKNYSRIPVQHAYLIDSDVKKWNLVLKGHKIYSPEELRSEDPEKTIIIVYSTFYEEINNKIKEFGNFIVLSIEDILSAIFVSPYYGKLGKIRSETLIKHCGSSKNAIIIQGPFVKDVTVQVVKSYAMNYPDDFIILSTWQETSEQDLKEIIPYVDEVVLTKIPDSPGAQNRNYQIASTVAGLSKARELGMDIALKARTDIMTFTNDIFERWEECQELYDCSASNVYGLKGRIIIPDMFTRKHLLYHVSDLIMCGYVDDLLTYWNVPQDLRNIKLSSEIFKDETIYNNAVHQTLAEVYVATEFCKKIGRPILYTLFDSWQFYRDFFVILDRQCFDLFWFKRPWANRFLEPHNIYELATHLFWNYLYFNDKTVVEMNSNLGMDIKQTRIKELGMTSYCLNLNLESLI